MRNNRLSICLVNFLAYVVTYDQILNGINNYQYNMNKLICLLAIVLLPQISHAEENEKFSQFMCKIISASQTVKDCTYNKEKEIVNFQTREGLETKVLCLWFDQNEKNQIMIDDADMTLKPNSDYVLIGYGQNSTNSRLYYYIPTKTIKKKMNLTKMKKYLLSWPIALHKF